jgi:exonuclease III
MDMRFGTWNVMSLCKTGSLATVARKISDYKLDLVGVQEVRWDRRGIEPRGDSRSFRGKGNENYELKGQEFCT